MNIHNYYPKGTYVVAKSGDIYETSFISDKGLKICCTNLRTGASHFFLPKEIKPCYFQKGDKVMFNKGTHLFTGSIMRIEYNTSSIGKYRVIFISSDEEVRKIGIGNPLLRKI